MQPLIQHIFTQIIDFNFYLSKIFSDFSWRNLLWESKQTFFFEDIVFGQKFQEMTKNIWTYCFPTFGIFNTQPLWLLIQGWEKGQESHYIQPSNLSSALELL